MPKSKKSPAPDPHQSALLIMAKVSGEPVPERLKKFTEPSRKPAKKRAK